MIELSADYVNAQLTNETEKIFHDLDLAILGSPKVTYQEYAIDIRKSTSTCLIANSLQGDRHFLPRS